MISTVWYTLLMKIHEKEHSRKLRRDGLSINHIVKITGYSKASVSVWVRDIVLTKDQRDKVSLNGRSVDSIEKRRVSRIKNEETKSKNILESAKKDFNFVTKSELKLIGISIYIGEGAKSKKGTVGVSSSDPAIIKIMIRFFKEICRVPNEKFRIQVHTFEHANISEVEKYWSQVTSIPISQFYKTYIKTSSASLHKRNTLPHGTIDLTINDSKLRLVILGWIERIKELII